MSARLVIYTVLTGDKEPLGNPVAELESNYTDLIIDFICFTDNRNLRSDVWQFHYIESGHLPPEKLSRRPKALPHDYLSNKYSISLYIDNIVSLKRLPCAADLATNEPYLFRVYRHLTRRHPGEEADAIVMIGYDDPNTICRQVDFYARLQPIESVAPLHTCTVILRAHNHPDLIRFGTTWWEQILNFSKRDQLSFDFAAMFTGCRIEPLPGMKEDSDLIHPPLDRKQGRVKASFDAVRYAWLHRHDPIAHANPQAHYLARGALDDEEYERHVPIFDYICHKRGSSLGSHVAPRRKVADMIQMACAPLREREGSFLSLRIRDEVGAEAFADEEFVAAETALSTYLHQHKGITADFAAQDFRSCSDAFLETDMRFDIVVILGLPSASVSAITEKLHALLKAEGGALVVICTAPVMAADIAEQEKQLAERLSVACRVAITTANHDNMKKPLVNSAFAFSW